jgi:hypothetical protein
MLKCQKSELQANQKLFIEPLKQIEPLLCVGATGRTLASSRLSSIGRCPPYKSRALDLNSHLSVARNIKS